MNDEQIINKGGTEDDINKYAEHNGANLTEQDVRYDRIIKELREKFYDYGGTIHMGGERLEDFEQFILEKLKEERIKTLEEVEEKFEYLKQCANGQKFPYWDLDERPSLIIQEIDSIINNLKN